MWRRHLSRVIIFPAVFTDRLLLLRLFRNAGFREPARLERHVREIPPRSSFLHTLYLHRLTLKLTALSLSLLLSITSSIPSLFLVIIYPPPPFSTHTLSSLLSGTLADRVQLSDDDGAGAEREPQRDGRRPLHTSGLPAALEGLYARSWCEAG